MPETTALYQVNTVGADALAGCQFEGWDHRILRGSGQHGAADDHRVAGLLGAQRLADLFADAG